MPLLSDLPSSPSSRNLPFATAVVTPETIASLPSDLFSVVTVGELEGSALRLSSSLIASAIHRSRDSPSSIHVLPAALFSKPSAPQRISLNLSPTSTLIFLSQNRSLCLPLSSILIPKSKSVNSDATPKSVNSRSDVMPSPTSCRPSLFSFAGFCRQNTVPPPPIPRRGLLLLLIPKLVADRAAVQPWSLLSLCSAAAVTSIQPPPLPPSI